MQIVLHAGVHMTDEDRLVNTLIRNRDLLAESGTAVPSPGSYRKPFRVLLRNADDTDLRETVMAAVSPGAEARRLILSVPGLLGQPRTAAGGGIFYAQAEERLAFLTRAFPQDQLELFFAIRNPASFLPAAFGASKQASMEEFLGGTDPLGLRWSGLITRLREALPGLPITVWCNEDTPLIWGELLRDIAGLDPSAGLAGEFSLLEEIMTGPGLRRFTSYLDAHPGLTEPQKRRVIIAFLEKFAVETAIEEELDAPGWTEELVEQLTGLYDADVSAIQSIGGIRVIAP